MTHHEYFYSVVLSQIFGSYLVIMAIILAGRASHYRTVIKNIDPNSFGVFISGSIGLLLGLFLVTIHTISGKFPLDLISLLFWFILIKAILLLSFPKKVIAVSQKIYSGSGYYITIAIAAVLGVILMANGYYLYM